MISKLGIWINKAHNIGRKTEYFRKLILAHLSKLEKSDEESVSKALSVMESLMAKSGFPVGTIRTWAGKRYIKAPDGKWKPKYDEHSRGAKMAISVLKKKITAAKDEHEMMQIILANRSRFEDGQGHPLPFVYDLSTFIRERSDAAERVAAKKRKKHAEKKHPMSTGEEKNKLPNEPGWLKMVQDATIRGEKLPGLAPDIDAIKNDIRETEEEIKKLKEKGNNKTELSRLEKTKLELQEELEFAIAKDKAMDVALAKNKELYEKLNDFEKIQHKYKYAKSISGDEDEIQAGKETLTGTWKLVEADTPTASHDETTFHKTAGFPTNADGSSINDRDYEHFEANKEAVLNVAGDFDGRALKFDNPVIVTTDGIVISGNNRTMSSKIAARKGTDKKYIEVLKKRAKKFGFTPEQVGQFKNPRVIFETEHDGGYSTAQFAKFNESGKKEMGPTEKAAKVSKMIKRETIETVAKKIDEFETIGELYQDAKASRDIYNIFKDAGLIGENEAGRYFENSALTDDGKTFIETALLGTVINEANLRGFNRPGCKSIRGTLLRALIPLVENKGLDGYSINKELNEAVDIAMQVALNRDKFRNVEEFSKQSNMFEKMDSVSIELAKKMEGTQKAFAEFMKNMNGGLKVAANGEVDIFLGNVESKEDILGRFLNLKKTLIDILAEIPAMDIKKCFLNLEG